MKKIITLLKVVKKVKNWPSYMGDYLKLKSGGCWIMRLRNGLNFLMRNNSTDRATFNEIWIHENYNPEGFEINKDDVVIDIGAHIGFFTVYASRKALNGRVFSFEPHPGNYNLLKENAALNKCRNASLFNSAVSSEKGRIKFFFSENNLCHSAKIQDKNSKITEVYSLTLREVMLKNKIKEISFLKMDCEGSEYDILFDMDKKSIQKIKKISMEYHNLDSERNIAKLKSFLEDNGFRVNIKPDGKTQGMIYAKKTAWL